ncbi:MAG: hypothetical protein HOJ89_02585, partial [Opitutales bacterium]|nr:hypothetical protein [Opitutales bacterium]
MLFFVLMVPMGVTRNAVFGSVVGVGDCKAALLAKPTETQIAGTCIYKAVFQNAEDFL